jgi:hypothetical protein
VPSSTSSRPRRLEDLASAGDELRRELPEVFERVKLSLALDPERAVDSNGERERVDPGDIGASTLQAPDLLLEIASLLLVLGVEVARDAFEAAVHAELANEGFDPVDRSA